MKKENIEEKSEKKQWVEPKIDDLDMDLDMVKAGPLFGNDGGGVYMTSS